MLYSYNGTPETRSSIPQLYANIWGMFTNIILENKARPQKSIFHMSLSQNIKVGKTILCFSNQDSNHLWG